MIERTFYVETEGHLSFLAAFLSRQTPPFQVVFGPVRIKRTSQQNARLWLLHTRAAEITGYSPEEMHEFALCRHFGFREIECDGIVRRVPLKRSSQREREEFTKFMESTEIWYGETFGVWLDDDGEDPPGRQESDFA